MKALVESLNVPGEKVPSCIRSDRQLLVDHFGSGNFELRTSQIVVTRASVYRLGSPEQTMPRALAGFDAGSCQCVQHPKRDSYEHRVSRQRLFGGGRIAFRRL